MSIYPLADEEGPGAIVKFTPPKAPFIASSSSSSGEKQQLGHVPCDIVLVIDVSTSMDAEAPMPRDPSNPEDAGTNAPGESTGLSVLDLVKHSCRTILTSMDKRDRLSIVKFSTGANVVQGLEFMTDTNKEKTLKNIERLHVEGVTNLWHGLKASFKVFEDAKTVRGNVPAIMLLTDGKPNHLCPPEGYIPALRKMDPIRPAIHTFGFGYTLRSGLLKSIAEFGGGNYAFIPDAGMIGTTFVHAVAHLQSTFAQNASLHLSCPDGITLHETTGRYVTKQTDARIVSDGRGRLTIPLGNIQYGQSRDMYLRWESDSRMQHTVAGNPVDLSATVTYILPNSTTRSVEHSANRSLADVASTSFLLSPPEIAYHKSRSQVCAFLADFFPLNSHEEHHVHKELEAKYGASISPGLPDKQAALAHLIQSLPANGYPDDPRCQALLQDLNGDEPFGQVTIALASQANFDRWGQHYLTSLHGAHVRQLCANFKDPGPLQYGTDSPLFLQCRDTLNKLFNELPPPTPSLPPGIKSRYGSLGPPRPPAQDPNATVDPTYRVRAATATVEDLIMESYNKSSSSCFAAETTVLLADDPAGRPMQLQLQRLRRGMRVQTPRGPRSVEAVLATPVVNTRMVSLDGVLVTPWHPVRSLQGAEWQFPGLCTQGQGCKFSDSPYCEEEIVRYTGYIYSVLLQQDADTDAHALLLSGPSEAARPFWGVTLGHGLVTAAADTKDDVRVHNFFGSYTRVVESLRGLTEYGDSLLLTEGVTRSEKTGLVCGFKKLRQQEQGDSLTAKL